MICSIIMRKNSLKGQYWSASCLQMPGSGLVFIRSNSLLSVTSGNGQVLRRDASPTLATLGSIPRESFKEMTGQALPLWVGIQSSQLSHEGGASCYLIWVSLLREARRWGRKYVWSCEVHGILVTMSQICQVGVSSLYYLSKAYKMKF